MASRYNPAHRMILEMLDPSRLIDRLAGARACTDELFALVRPVALQLRPIAERHRLIFYLGHLEAFDRNLLAAAPLDAGLDSLFAFGIDPTDGNLPTDRPSDWPTAEQTRAYGARCRHQVDSRVARGVPDALLLDVCVEHRLMHAETLAYALNQLEVPHKIPPPGYRPAVASGVSGRSGPGRPGRARRAGLMVEIPAGPATLGMRRRENGPFGWDNEFETLVVQVPAFAIERHDVTNGRYLEFVLAGGYQDPGLWSESGWRWVTSAGISHPAFWRRSGDRWVYRAMFGEIPLPPDWPVYVSHEEASAFARWAGAALPTEAQFHRAAFGTPSGDERVRPWGSEPPAPRHGNFMLRSWDPGPVGSWPDGDSAFGVADLCGNGWEWTSTPFGPFPGFEPFPFYPGYSADFFGDGTPGRAHYVLKGGAARTAAPLLRRSFRNWFQPRYPYVHAAFRLVES